MQFKQKIFQFCHEYENKTFWGLFMDLEKKEENFSKCFHLRLNVLVAMMVVFLKRFR